MKTGLLPSQSSYVRVAAFTAAILGIGPSAIAAESTVERDCSSFSAALPAGGEFWLNSRATDSDSAFTSDGRLTLNKRAVTTEASGIRIDGGWSWSVDADATTPWLFEANTARRCVGSKESTLLEYVRVEQDELARSWLAESSNDIGATLSLTTSFDGATIHTLDDGAVLIQSDDEYRIISPPVGLDRIGQRFPVSVVVSSNRVEYLVAGNDVWDLEFPIVIDQGWSRPDIWCLDRDGDGWGWPKEEPLHKDCLVVPEGVVPSVRREECRCSLAANRYLGSCVNDARYRADCFSIDLGDNCPSVANRAQADSNRNGVGDVCEIRDALAHASSGSIERRNDGSVSLAVRCDARQNPNLGDANRDGIADACENDRDGDGVRAASDLNDLNPSVADASAPEICDGLDNNGNGLIDEGTGCERCQ
ncbi:MAG: thrombospondin type 3 repeat-containing protein [Myxococcota bacterium]